MPIGVLEILTGILIIAAGGVIVQRYRHHLRRKQSQEEWYKDALGLISRVERIGHQTTEYQDEIDMNNLRVKLDPISEDLRVHAESGPSTIPPESKARLKFLSDITTGLTILADQRNEMSSTEMLANLQFFVGQRVEKEDQELPDMDELNEIFESIDIDAIAEQLLDEEVTFDEQKLEGLLDEVDDETLENKSPQSVEEAINFPFEEMNELVHEFDLVDEVMVGGMREIVRLWLIDVPDKIYRHMEAQRDRV